ncbi:unnamed protein product [Lampetra fluviatilis]
MSRGREGLRNWCVKPRVRTASLCKPLLAIDHVAEPSEARLSSWHAASQRRDRGVGERQISMAEQRERLVPGRREKGNIRGERE